jgi:hypothetical protein
MKQKRNQMISKRNEEVDAYLIGDSDDNITVIVRGKNTIQKAINEQKSGKRKRGASSIS